MTAASQTSAPLTRERRRRSCARRCSVGIATRHLRHAASGRSPSLPGSTPGRRMALSLLMFTGGSQFAFVSIIGTGGLQRGARPRSRRRRCSASATGSTACRATHLLGVARAAPGRRRPPDHRRVDRRRPWPRTTSAPPASGFWLTGARGLRAVEPHHPRRRPPRQRARRPAHLRSRCRRCAAFTALLWPRLRSRDAVAIAVVGAVVAVVLSPTMPPGIPVVAAAAAALLAWRTPRREQT